MDDDVLKQIVKEIDVLMKSQSREAAKLIVMAVIISSLFGGLAGALVVAILKK